VDEYKLADHLKKERNLTPQETKKNLTELRKNYELLLVAKKSEETINRFIQETNLERIPHSQLTNIQFLAEGGFGKIYQSE
jgi:hypothetical protein